MRDLADLDELECPDEIEDIDQLREILCPLIDRQNRLLVEVRRLDKLVIDAQERSRDASADLDAIQADLDRLRDHVDVVDATMPNQQQDKLDKIRGILSYAVEEARGGRVGVIVETGEATAAAQTSRNTALRLMDEIGTNFEWASLKNPGGPNPKQLRLAIDDQEVHDLMDDVRTHYQGGGAVSG